MTVSFQLNKNFLYLVQCHAEGIIEVTKKSFVGGHEGNDQTRNAIRARVNELVELLDAVLGPWPSLGHGGQL